MPHITVLPHEQICPEGAEIEAEEGASLCETLLDHDIPIEHACEMSCACTTCHVVVRKGFNSLNPSSDDEEDLLDAAWGLEATSRLSCQVKVGKEDLVVEIPKYSINQVRENG
jgi:2Fe-2S ferredoxin